MDRVRFLLLLLLFSVSVADLQSDDIMDQRRVSAESVNVEQPQPCPSDLHAVLRDITAKLASLQTKMDGLEKQNQEQATKLVNYEDEIRRLQTFDTEQAFRLTDQVNKLLELQSKTSEVDPIKEELRGQAAELNNIKTQTNVTENQMELLRRDREVGRVAFSASLFESGGGTHGPISTDTTLVFKQVFLNLGNAYNSNTGIFTAPVRGIYHFDYHIFTASSYVAYVRLVKNAEYINSVYEGQSHDQGSTSNGVTLLLQAGDVVFLRLMNGNRIYDSYEHYCGFSGHLIFLM